MYHVTFIKEDLEISDIAETMTFEHKQSLWISREQYIELNNNIDLKEIFMDCSSIRTVYLLRCKTKIVKLKIQI